MSVIFAGKKCKQCGEKYYVTFGHPKWYKDWLKKKKSPQSRRWEALVRTRKCPACLTGTIERWAAGVLLLKRIEYGRQIRRRKVGRIIKRRSQV